MRAFGVCALFMVLTHVQGKVLDGYIINRSDGHGYKLVYQAQSWTKARELCMEDDAKLAVPKSEEQFAFIQKLVRAMHYPSITNSEYKLLVWLGINNQENYPVWENVDGENIEDTGYHKWVGVHNGQAFSANPAEPHCVGVDAINPGLRDFWCHRRQPYICEIQTPLEV